MRSPWKLLAALEALALLAVFVLWPRGEAGETGAVDERTTPARSPESGVPRVLEDEGDVKAGHALRSEHPRSEASTDEALRGLGILLVGQVTNEEGQELDSAGVRLEMPDGEWVSTSTDGFGNYALPGLSGGSYRMSVGAKGYRLATRTVVLDTAPAVQRADFSLDVQRTILIRLETSQGEELIDWLIRETDRRHVMPGLVSVVLTEDPVERFVPSHYRTQQSRHGRFEAKYTNRGDEAPDRYSGTLSPHSPLPLHASVVFRDDILASFRLEDGVDEITIPVDETRTLESLCEVTFRVVDDLTGAPVEGARVGANAHYAFASGTTDAEGRARLEAVPPGMTWVTASAQGYRYTRQEVLLEAGPPVDLGELRLRGSTQLKVTGYLPDGSLAANFTCYFYDPSESRFGPAGVQIVGFDLSGEGEHTVPCPVGRIAIVVKETDRTAREVQEVEVPADGAELILRLKPGRKVVVDTRTVFSDPYRFTLRDATGKPYGRTLTPGLQNLRLPPGSYSIDVTTTVGDPVQIREFTVGSEPLRIELDLP